ncbi:MAG: MmgE/PrpD family protein [Betaproteobacteria bacterium]|nr:MmgE/PrpD family protein [Betaproteobacteria bacterium]
MASRNLDAVCDFIAGAQSRPFPAEVLDAAKQCVVDWVAVSVAALKEPGPRIVRDYVKAWQSRGSALSLYGDKGAAASIALVNGTLAHSLDYDDLHLGTAYHASGPTLAAALATGMDRKRSGRDILSAFIVGFEIGAAAGQRDIGVALAHHGWQPTGILGHFSSVAAAAALLGLDRHRLANGFGLAATQAAGLIISAGSTAKPFHVGKAAMNGVIAAELAAQGLDASPEIFDDDKDGVFASLLQTTIEPDFQDLGRVWQITRNSFKPYAACQLTHAPFEAAQQLKDEFQQNRVRSIRAFVNPLAAKVAGKTQPKTPIESKFSIAYCEALGLHGHAAVPDDFSQARLSDREIAAAADRVEVVPVESMQRWASRVELDRDDGTRSATVEAALGSLDRPLRWPEIETKFMMVTEPVYNKQARALLSALRCFDEPGRLDEIAAIIEGTKGTIG